MNEDDGNTPPSPHVLFSQCIYSGGTADVFQYATSGTYLEAYNAYWLEVTHCPCCNQYLFREQRRIKGEWSLSKEWLGNRRKSDFEIIRQAIALFDETVRALGWEVRQESENIDTGTPAQA